MFVLKCMYQELLVKVALGFFINLNDLDKEENTIVTNKLKVIIDKIIIQCVGLLKRK